ncbi:MAG: precorrin-4 C(11)-methyltransferase [Firmicutes bacterium]|nr:precorrin-4 C(11)-methyltransferase [Bacillota bacterium]
MTVYFVGAGPGDPELITLKGARLLREADVIIYAGSLVNPDILVHAGHQTKIIDSAGLDLPQIITLIKEAQARGKRVVRLHTGDPSLFGAIQEQADLLRAAGIDTITVPGVSSFAAAAAAIKRELTIPEVSQTVIITRLAGRTPVPEKERLQALAAHRASMCIFLSVGMMEQVTRELRHAYATDTPVAVVEKASWPAERVIRGTLSDIAKKVADAGITKTAMILVGDFLREEDVIPSRLYAPEFTHGYRVGSGE